MSQHMIDRRTLIRNLLFASAGVVLLPACVQNEGKASIALQAIRLSDKDEALLASLCDTLLPTTDSPGAKELGLHLFAMKMLDDCYPKRDQDKILKGMRAFEDEAQKQFDASFVKCTPAQKSGLLQTLEAQKTKDTEIIMFYTTIKKLAIQGFTTSQYYLTRVHKYELVPGRFHGCVPVIPSSTNAAKTV